MKVLIFVIYFKCVFFFFFFWPNRGIHPESIEFKYRIEKEESIDIGEERSDSQ